MNYIKITKDINNYLLHNLTKKRYLHSMEVAKMSFFLAKKFNINTQVAFLTGLAHDICREMSKDYLKSEMKILTGYSQDFFNLPQLYHGPVGAEFLKKNFSISDSEILDGVRFHSTGSKVLTKLGKIVFVSDYISLDRTHLTKEDRGIFYSLDLDNMVRKVLLMTDEYLRSKGSKLILESIELLNKVNGEYYGC